jgi:hypothetical protein
MLCDENFFATRYRTTPYLLKEKKQMSPTPVPPAWYVTDLPKDWWPDDFTTLTEADAKAVRKLYNKAMQKLGRQPKPDRVVPDSFRNLDLSGLIDDLPAGGE